MTTGAVHTRVPSLWFEDGTLVVKAQTSLFKVHRSLLSARSSVFRDMLAFPQHGVGETLDDCPLVELPDGGAAVEHLLRAIYDSAYFMPHPEKIELAELLDILLLAHKYDVKYLFIQALKHLDAVFYFPSYTSYQESRHKLLVDGDVWDSEFAFNVAPLAAVHAALVTVDARWLLPLVRYKLSTAFVASIAETPELDVGLIRQLLLWRQELDLYRVMVIAPISDPEWTNWNGDEECDGSPGCSEARRRVIHTHIKYEGIRVLDWTPKALRGLCAACRALCEQGVDAAWHDLPVIFKVGSWGSLNVMRAEMLEL
ncbi:BTB domain-containing protein [Mycena kentingensis (nom. inval.)]|nr:BTB domain-containing protein [Mycena kentingensis (nom. inval.)]